MSTDTGTTVGVGLAEPLLGDVSVTPAEAIVRAAVDAGIEVAIGIPGGNTQGIFDALYDHQDKIRTVLVREESLAAIMAEIHGTLKGKPALVVAQGAWVVANCAMGMLDAFTGSSPMVVLCDMTDGGYLSHHAVYQSATGEYGNWDVKRSLDGYTKLTTVAYDPVQAVQHVQQAVKHSVAGQAGPVAVVLHSAALTGEVGPDSTPRLYRSTQYLGRDARPAEPAAIDAAAAALVGAKSPIIVAGNGVRIGAAFAELRGLAEALRIPVVTTNGGKGVFPEDHELALGLIGSFGLEAANGELAAADVVLVVGSRLGAVDTCGENPDLLDPSRQEIHQIDIEQRNARWVMPTAGALVGDAATTLAALTERAVERGGRADDDIRARLAAARERGDFEAEASFSDVAPVKPQRLVRDLWRSLPSDAVVLCDAGENRLYMAHHYRARAANGFIQPAGIGGMGFAIPAALGAKLAEPERVAVAVCGDGGFAMTCNGLMTAVEEQLPIVVVVMNNRMLGWVRHCQGDRPIASELGNFDHAAIGRAMGAQGFTVTAPGELAEAIVTAAATVDRPTVIDVSIDPTESFLSTQSNYGGTWTALV
ncbi:MAG: thiamine pyrophosphate-binding protein [Solirubrobacterales bacterium]